MEEEVKQENVAPSPSPGGFPRQDTDTPVIDVSDGDSDLEDTGSVVGAKRARECTSVEEEEEKHAKRVTGDELALVLPQGSGQRLPPPPSSSGMPSGGVGGCKQFWKAGDYEGAPDGSWDMSSGGFDHVRVHPKFLHSNATSHKWALGAFAELLDNALDEVVSGATYVNVDMLEYKKAETRIRMLLIEDNGGGMNPEKMRQCMSLGYSAKSKIANTIGQYGNGFKTSTMRLGADVIVFSRSRGKDGISPTQSIGLLSYTFLKSTGKEDIVVPMLDYERRDQGWSKIARSSLSDWDKNVETITQWSPFSSEQELLRQFALINDRGTRVIIYNLWENDEGKLELDFDADPHDIQLRGANRDEKNISMAAQYPNSRHFLTYKHSLRSYVSILYLRIAARFRIILRGRDVEHHSVVNDMMQTEQITYRPQYGADSFSDLSAVVTIGFVKDAKHHIDVQGFNVYHKNRLIKPFWRIWNVSGSDGRGVIGVLEANFVEPAHDKQDFERTIVLSRLESRLILMQKIYWNTNCHKIGYAPRRERNAFKDSSPKKAHGGSDPSGNKTRASEDFNSSSYPNHTGGDGSLSLQEEVLREKERRKELEAEVYLQKQRIEELEKERDTLIEIFSEERDRRDAEEEILRKKLEEATNRIDELLNKINNLEGHKGPSWRR